MQYTEYLGCFHAVSSLFNPEHNLTVDGEQTLTLDEMMQHYARACDGGCICLICGKCLSKSYNMRRHMRKLHLSSASDEDHHCTPCDKHFKNRLDIYNHIRRNHKDWTGVDFDSFNVEY